MYIILNQNMTVFADIKLGEYLWTCRYPAYLCSYLSHVLGHVQVCSCVYVFVLCSDFIFCHFSVMFLAGYSSHGTSFEDDLSLGAEGEWYSCKRLESVQKDHVV